MAINKWNKENPEHTKEIQAKYDAKRRSQKRLDYKKNRQIANNYGITVEDYDRMFQDQGGRCKICGTLEAHSNISGRRFSIDHCHATGKIRGLLCVRCNTGIGMFKDNIDYLISAISYLQENS